MITLNTTLSKLSLTDNSIPSDSICYIQDALELNTSLRSFSFGGQKDCANEVCASSRIDIMRSINRNIKIWRTNVHQGEEDILENPITTAISNCITIWENMSPYSFARKSSILFEYDRRPLGLVN